MRPLAPSDLSTAARMLLVLPDADRVAVMGRVISEAEAADRYRKRIGQAHPFWGNGSLEAAARARPLAPPRKFSDSDYLACIALALDVVLVHRRCATHSCNKALIA